MDENVIFDNNPAGSDDGSQPPQEPVASPPPNAAPESIGEIPVEQAQAEATGTPAEGEPGQTLPPPSSGGGLLKKLLIGFVVVIILIFLVILFLPKGKNSRSAKLVWWGLWEDQTVVQPLIDDFHKQHPNITVEYVKQDPKQYREKLLTRIKNGTGPDIFRFHNTWLPMLSDSLTPFSTDVMSPTEFKKTFYPVMEKDLTVNGGIYGLPLGADTLSLFINTDIFHAAGAERPQTWDDFVNLACKLTVKDENQKIKTAGAALGTFGNITHAPDILSLLFVQQGVNVKKFGSNPADESEALNFYTSFAKSSCNSWDGTLDESILSFARGNLAMYIGYSWDIFRIQAINKNLPFKIYPVPQLVGRKAALASYWSEGISSQSPNKQAAMLFMQYLARRESAQMFYTQASKTRAFGELYARKDLAESLKKNELVYPFVQQLPIANSSLFASDTNDGDGGINSMSNTYLGNAVNSIINDNSSVDTAVETLDKGITQVFQKYGVQ